MKTLIALILIALAAPAGAQAAKTQSTNLVSTDPHFYVLAHEAQAPMPAGYLKAIRGYCPSTPDALGCAGQWAVWVRPGMTDARTANTFYHEAAHIFDDRHLIRHYRLNLRTALGWPEDAQWTAPLYEQSPSEHYAVAMAWCYKGRSSWQTDPLTGNYGFSRPKSEVLKVCNISGRAFARSTG